MGLVLEEIEYLDNLIENVVDGNKNSDLRKSLTIQECINFNLSSNLLKNWVENVRV